MLTDQPLGFDHERLGHHPVTQSFASNMGAQSQDNPGVDSNGGNWNENNNDIGTVLVEFPQADWYSPSGISIDDATLTTTSIGPLLPTNGDMFNTTITPMASMDEQMVFANNTNAPAAGFQFPMMQGPVALKPRTPCQYCMGTFTRASDLARHIQSVHLGIKHHCSFPSCPNNRGKGYCRLEKLRTHQKEKHGFTLV